MASAWTTRQLFLTTDAPGKTCPNARVRAVGSNLALKSFKVAASAHGSLAVRMATDAPGGGKGGNVIDRPDVLPGQDVKKQSKSRRPPPYKVLLHNDNANRREYVVKVLLKVVDGMTVDDAVNIMQEAHINGLAMVISCPQVDAENYCKQLRSNGLVATMEPDS